MNPEQKKMFEELQKSFFGKIATQVIQEYGNSKEKILQDIESQDGLAKMIGSITTKLESEMKNLHLEPEDLLNQALATTAALPSLTKNIDVSSLHEKVKNVITNEKTT